MIVFTGVVYNTNIKIFLFSYSLFPLSILIIVLSIAFYVLNYWMASTYIKVWDIYLMLLINIWNWNILASCYSNNCKY